MAEAPPGRDRGDAVAGRARTADEVLVRVVQTHAAQVGQRGDVVGPAEGELQRTRTDAGGGRDLGERDRLLACSSEP
jgi:hypothetical protein